MVLKDRTPIYFIECKYSDSTIAQPLKYLNQRFPEVPAIQLIFEEGVDFRNDAGIRVCSAGNFLKDLV